jgi:hypothetical protein
MNAQLYTLRDVTRLPTGDTAIFLRTTAPDSCRSVLVRIFRECQAFLHEGRLGNHAPRLATQMFP